MAIPAVSHGTLSPLKRPSMMSDRVTVRDTIQIFANVRASNFLAP